MAPSKTGQSNASTPEPTEAEKATAKRAHTDGAQLGRLASKLNELYAEEKEQLERSPEVIKAAFAQKREKLLEGLDAEQRDGVINFAKVLAPKAAE